MPYQYQAMSFQILLSFCIIITVFAVGSSQDENSDVELRARRVKPDQVLVAARSLNDPVSMENTIYNTYTVKSMSTTYFCSASNAYLCPQTYDQPWTQIDKRPEKLEKKWRNGQKFTLNIGDLQYFCFALSAESCPQIPGGTWIPVGKPVEVQQRKPAIVSCYAVDERICQSLMTDNSWIIKNYRDIGEARGTWMRRETGAMLFCGATSVQDCPFNDGKWMRAPYFNNGNDVMDSTPLKITDNGFGMSGNDKEVDGPHGTGNNVSKVEVEPKKKYDKSLQDVKKDGKKNEQQDMKNENDTNENKKEQQNGNNKKDKKEQEDKKDASQTTTKIEDKNISHGIKHNNEDGNKKNEGFTRIRLKSSNVDSRSSTTQAFGIWNLNHHHSAKIVKTTTPETIDIETGSSEDIESNESNENTSRKYSNGELIESVESDGFKSNELESEEEGNLRTWFTKVGEVKLMCRGRHRRVCPVVWMEGRLYRWHRINYVCFTD